MIRRLLAWASRERFVYDTAPSRFRNGHKLPREVAGVFVLLLSGPAWLIIRLAAVVGYPSGQRGQTVNLLAYAFDGSNPSPTTTLIFSQ